MAGLAFLLALLAPLVSAEEPVVTPVYKSDFGKGVDPALWSKADTMEVGGTTILVPGWNSTFTKRGLPKHKYVRARVALTILGTFDGSDRAEGPDNWSMLSKGGTLLLLTNFRNGPPNDRRGVEQGIGQAFPDEYPAGLHPSGTGAARVNAAAGAMESLYAFEIIFPHSDAELVLHFQEGMRNHGDPKTENWGIRSLEIDVLSSHFERTDAQLAQFWAALIGADPVAANEVVWKLVASGEKGAEFVREKAAARAGVEAAEEAKRLEPFKEEIDELVELLDSEVFTVRQAALFDLAKMPPERIPLLEAKLEEDLSPEGALGVKGALRVMRKRRPVGVEHRHRGVVQSRVAHVLRLHDTIASGRKITATESEFPSPLASLDDGFVPAELSGHTIPRFDWWNVKGGKEGWVQYGFPKARTFDSAEVYWFANVNWDQGAKLPESWRLSYLDGEDWKPVKLKGNYGITLGEFDRVEFEPVETTAIRLTARSTANRISLLEFRLGEKDD